MVTKPEALKHLDELEQEVDVLRKGSDALERRALEQAGELKEQKELYEELRKTDNALIADLRSKVESLEVSKPAYDALVKIVEPVVKDMLKSHKVAVGSSSNPTSGTTTLVDHKLVVDVQVKEDEVTIDTSTNRGKILRLAAKGFFKDWRKAGEVSDELEKRGQTMNNKVVMMELANLTNLGYLGRTKRENQFVYKVPDEGVVFKD